MGAWGDGLLDSDNAQDFIGKFVRGIEQDVIEIHEMNSPKLAGNLSAAVGILLRLSHPFDPMPNIGGPPHFYPRLVCALSANFLHYMNYPKMLRGYLPLFFLATVHHFLIVQRN